MRVVLGAFSLAILLATGVVQAASADLKDWSTSPEAYFLTLEERRAWAGLQSETAREEFQRTYWKRRDPSPSTERNEFREKVQARIRSADAQLTMGKTPGSRTARGMVLIMLGRPSMQHQTIGPIKGRAPEMTTPGRLTIPNDAFSTTEFHTWIYERDTRADLLDVLGIAHLEISFIVEPGHRDELQEPARFQQWRELLARQTIVSE